MEWIGYIGIGILVLLVLLVLVTNIQIVQQSRAYVVERLGAYSATWGVGLHFKIPFFERVVKKVSLKEQVADFDPQPVITKDNVTMQIDTVIYFQITDPKLYTYGVEHPMNAIENLTATTLRNIIGDMELDQSLTSRDTINSRMRSILDEATDPWGIKVNRVELKNIEPPVEIRQAMEKQMKADREKRASILLAEGEKQAAITRAEGEKESAILRAEAVKQQRIREAEGEAEALLTVQKAQADAIGMKMLEKVGLADRADSYPRQLSGGQAQRVAVGRAIVKKPDVFLFDEPLSNLDAKLRASMRIRISDLHKQLKKSGKPATTVYVTHDQTEALTLADKIGIMKDGSLIAHGETHELYHYPPNRFSAEFLGRANILQATALKDSPEPGLVSVSCGGGLINAFSRGGLHGNNKLLCIRPQHMSLAPRSATSNRLNATLTSVHWQGDLTHLLCDVAGEAVRIVMTQVNPLPRAGDKLSLYFEPGDAVLIEVQ